MTSKVKVLSLIVLAAALGTTGALAQQDQPKPAEPSAGAHSGMMMGGKMARMGDQSTKMMAMREKMMADMKAMDAKMDLKVAAMNAAESPAKTDAIAAVINEMVFQQKQMMANMDTMCKQMMENMAHPDAPMKGMKTMGKEPAGIPK